MSSAQQKLALSRHAIEQLYSDISEPESDQSSSDDDVYEEAPETLAPGVVGDFDMADEELRSTSASEILAPATLEIREDSNADSSESSGVEGDSIREEESDAHTSDEEVVRSTQGTQASIGAQASTGAPPDNMEGVDRDTAESTTETRSLLSRITFGLVGGRKSVTRPLTDPERTGERISFDTQETPDKRATAAAARTVRDKGKAPVSSRILRSRKASEELPGVPTTSMDKESRPISPKESRPASPTKARRSASPTKARRSASPTKPRQSPRHSNLSPGKKASISRWKAQTRDQGLDTDDDLYSETDSDAESRRSGSSLPVFDKPQNIVIEIVQPAKGKRRLLETTATDESELDDAEPARSKRRLNPVSEGEEDVDENEGAGNIEMPGKIDSTSNAEVAESEVDEIESVSSDSDDEGSARAHHEYAKYTPRFYTAKKLSGKSRKRYNRNLFSHEEEQTLIEALTKLDPGIYNKWSTILSMYPDVFTSRTGVNLKDKARNIALEYLRAGKNLPDYLAKHGVVSDTVINAHMRRRRR